MKASRLGIAVALLACLVAGKGSAAAAPPAMVEAGRVVPDGFVLDADGSTLVHVASKTRFPAEVAGFARSKEAAFDLTGEYVAIGYDRPLPGNTANIIVRVALVHIRDMSARDHYDIMRSAAMAHFSSPTVVSEGPYVIASDPGLSAYQGIFAGIRGGEPWHFSLTTINYGYWAGRITAAYPQKYAAEAKRDLADFVAALRQKPVPPQ
ncbi:hypothetical protein [Sphingomonas oryzagri]